MIMSSEAALQASDNLIQSDFYLDGHKTIFSVAKELVLSGVSVNIVLLTDKLATLGKLEDAGGRDYILSLMDDLQGAVSSLTDNYIAILKEKALRRGLIQAAEAILLSAATSTGQPEEIAAQAEYGLLAATRRLYIKDSPPFKEVVSSAVERIVLADKDPTMLSGLPTGLGGIDRILCGLKPGEFYVVAARPSIGKTTFGANLAVNMAVGNNIPVLFFSIEMGEEQLANNMLINMADVDGYKARLGYLASDGLDRIVQEAAPALFDAPIRIESPHEITINGLVSKARRIVREFTPECIFVDYIQLMSSPGLNRQQEVSDMSRKLKALGRDLNIPLVGLSQLNRNNVERANTEPRLSDIRESGSIEQDADVVMLLHRWDYYDKEDRPGELQVNVAKNRNGPTGTTVLKYNRDRMSIKDMYS